MVFELERYGDLFDFLKKNGAVTDLKLLKYIFLEVCEGLKALHLQGNLSHLDLKLENVLVSDSGSLKLCDFGLVQSATDPLAISQGT